MPTEYGCSVEDIGGDLGVMKMQIADMKDEMAYVRNTLLQQMQKNLCEKLQNDFKEFKQYLAELEEKDQAKRKSLEAGYHVEMKTVERKLQTQMEAMRNNLQEQMRTMEKKHQAQIKINFGMTVLFIVLLVGWCIREMGINDPLTLKPTPTCQTTSQSANVTDELHSVTTVEQLNTLALEINKLKLNFSAEDDKFWDVVLDPIRSLIQEGDTAPPVMVLIATSRSNRDIAECLIREVATLVGTLFEDNDNMERHIIIEPIRMRYMDPGVSKDKLDRALISNYQERHTTAVIHDLGYLPLETIGLLHSYCDPATSQFRKSILLTTVYPDPNTIPISEEEVVANLREYWKEIEKEVLNPLMSIISQNIAIMSTMEVHGFCMK